MMCDFKGYIFPEIVKVRPVVIITSNYLFRHKLCTVVPLSTTPPEDPQPYHYKLKANPIPGNSAAEVWAKCDLVATVSFERLDRVKVGRRQYHSANIAMEQVKLIRIAAAISIGIEFD